MHLLYLNRKKILDWIKKIVFKPSRYKGYKWRRMGGYMENDNYAHFFIFKDNNETYTGVYIAPKDTETTDKEMAEYILDFKKNTLKNL